MAMSERIRLETLCARDGIKGAMQWAERTAGVYHFSIRDMNHYASQPDWRPLFEQCIHELKLFAETGVTPGPTAGNNM